MKLNNLLLFVCILYINVNIILSAKKVGFLRDQKACRVKCYNGGICVYNIDDPNEHECRCFEGVFEGKYCQYKVTSPVPTQMIHITPNPRDIYTRKQYVDEQDFVANEEQKDTVIEPESESEENNFMDESVTVENYEEMDKYPQYNDEHDEIEEEEESESQIPSGLDSPGHYIEPATEKNLNRQKSKTTHSIENDYEDSGSWQMDARKGNSGINYHLSLNLICFILLFRLFY